MILVCPECGEDMTEIEQDVFRCSCGFSAEQLSLTMERKMTMASKWIGKPSPKSRHVGNGWFGELDRAYVDISQQYAVMTRQVETEWGQVIHTCIRNTDSTDIPWAEKQRIKNELLGEERTAIEFFPAKSELVDEANMYHLWVLPADMKIPFGL